MVRLRAIFFGLGGDGAAGVPSSSGAASASGAACCSAGAVLAVVAACLPLDLDFACFAFGGSAGAAEAAAAASAFCCSCCPRAPLYRSFGTPCSRPGTPSGNTGLRSPGSFFLLSSQSSISVGSKLDNPPEQPASAADNATRTAAAIRRCERRMVDIPITFLSPPYPCRQLFATDGSKACSASARERMPGGVSASLAIISSHWRAAVVSLARQADSASNSRALWR